MISRSLKIKIVFFYLVACTFMTECRLRYSMSGVDLGDAKTVSVTYFQNNASLAKSTYSASITESLKDILTSQSPLTLTKQGADLQFEGSVTAYAITPVGIQGGTDLAAQNRLTISINVKFTNNKDEKKNFESAFTRFADFNSTQSLASVEDALIKTINDQLVQDIFNKALINW